MTESFSGVKTENRKKPMSNYRILSEDGCEVDVCVLLIFFGELWQAALDRLNHRADGHLLTIRHQGHALRIYRRVKTSQ